MPEKHYTAKDIKVLEGLEHVRLRPAMYVGSVARAGLHQLLTILLDNVMDEALEGYGQHLAITLDANGAVLAEDDGRGVPVVRHPESGKTTLELVFTTLAACYCGCEGGAGHRRSLFGVGVSVINALSAWLSVETSREGKLYRMRFERGKAVSELECLGVSKAPGTRIHFLPDRSIFDADAEFDRGRLLEEFNGLAALAPGFVFELIDQRLSSVFAQKFHCPRGLGDLVQGLAEVPRLALPIVGSASEDWPEDDARAELRLAIQADQSDLERIVGFVNNSRVDAGSHVDGLIQGMDQGFKDAAKSLALPAPKQRPAGLIAALAIEFPYPQFEGSTRERLWNPPATKLSESLARRTVAQWGKEHPNELRSLLSLS